MRKVNIYPAGQVNSMRRWAQVVNPLKVIRNFAVIQCCRYLPSLRLKNFCFRHLLGMKIGRRASVGLMAMFDIFFPQYISVGDNSIIGYNSTILAHEYLIREYRTGEVQIGRDVLIGANVTILPGVTIGDGAVIGACSLVNADIPPGVFAAGVPARVVRTLATGVQS